VNKGKSKTCKIIIFVEPRIQGILRICKLAVYIVGSMHVFFFKNFEIKYVDFQNNVATCCLYKADFFESLPPRR
jgi:hypothetical protein